MRKKIKWGIIGLGNIAHQFVQDLALIEEAELAAVASRNLDKAQKFGNTYGAKKVFGSYTALFESDDIDIVYIATPHDSHAKLSIEALNKGKHVLCEKPIALNQVETNQMIDASKKQNKFLMEALWTRFNPSFIEAYDKIKKGELGELKYINADFAFHMAETQVRMIDLQRGGGSLLDMGVYPIFLAYMCLGIPNKIMASAHFYDTGADKQTSMIFQYENANAVLHCSFVSPSNMIATISGTKGRINLNPIWHEMQSYDLIKNNNKTSFNHPTKGKGFSYEIEECHHCINSGKIESKFWSHQNSIELIQIVDRVRESIGLRFPSETSHK